MLRSIVAIVVGVVFGIAIGTTVIAPGLAPEQPRPAHIEPEAPKRILPVPDNKAGKVVRWTLTSAFSPGMPHLAELAKRIDHNIWRLSGGTFEIRLAENGNTSMDLHTAVAAGARDAVFAPAGLWKDRSPAFQLFSGIPFGPDAETFLAWFYAGEGRDIYEKLHRRHGVHGLLCGMTAGSASGWFQAPVRAAADLKSLRIRVNGLGAKVLAHLGAVPVDMTEGNVLAAFEAGTLDAAVLSMPSMDGELSLEKLARHYYFPGWHQPTAFYELIVNLRQWEGLSATEKARLESVCGNNVRVSLAEAEAAQFAALKDLQGRGVIIHRWPGEVLDALKAAWSDVVTEQAGTDPDFRKAWTSLKSFRELQGIWRELGKL